MGFAAPYKAYAVWEGLTLQVDVGAFAALGPAAAARVSSKRKTRSVATILWALSTRIRMLPIFPVNTHNAGPAHMW